MLVVSEELDELFELSDRLHVVARGRLSPSVPIAQATVARIGEWMSGLWHEEVQADLAQPIEVDLTAAVKGQALFPASQGGGQHAQA